MALSTEVAEAEDGLEWRRPHPFTIVIEIGSALRQVAIALFAVGGGFFNLGSLLEIVVVAAPLAAAIGRWYTTRYALGAESVHHRYGLLRRRKQVLPRANVQNVSTRAGLVARIGSVVELHISDASSSGDIKLRLVSRQEADRLTTVLRSDIAGRPDADLDQPQPGADQAQPGAGATNTTDTATTTAGIDENASAPTDTLEDGQRLDAPSGSPVWREATIEPSLGRLALAELTSLASIGAAAAALAAVVALFVVIGRTDGDVIDAFPAVVGIVGFAFPLIPLIVVAASRLAVFGGYRLFAEPDRLRIEAGLLTEARITARRERIQLLEVERDLSHRMLGIERVRYETADIETQGTVATTYLSPAGSTDEWRWLAEIAIGGATVAEHDLRPVSRLTMRRTAVRGLLPLAVAATAGWLLSPILTAVIALGGLAAIAWYARSRHRVIGWAVDETHCLIRTGVFARRLRLVRLDKIQIVRTSAGLFQRRLGLANVGLSTAGTGDTGLIVIPDLDATDATRLAEQLAERAARTPLPETL